METEKMAESQRKNLENQLNAERERAERMMQKIQDVNRQELEAKKIMSQLEAAKAMNAGLRDQVEEFRHKQHMEEGGFKPSDLKKRLKKFTHEFKTNKLNNTESCQQRKPSYMAVGTQIPKQSETTC